MLTTDAEKNTANKATVLLPLTPALVTMNAATPCAPNLTPT